MPTAFINETERYDVLASEGLPCLVMHGGLGFDHSYLHPWLNPFGDRLDLIWYDHRGNGRSGRPARETMTLEQSAADADTLAQHLGLDRVAAIGHSHGGFIALELALRKSERLSHLILLDTAPPSNYGDEIVANARRKGATEEMMAVLAANFASDEEVTAKLPIVFPLYFKNFDPDLCQRLVGNCILAVSGFGREGEQEAYNVVPRLGEIHVPTSILVGRDDFVCPPSQAQVMYEGLPDSELVIFEGSGHFP